MKDSGRKNPRVIDLFLFFKHFPFIIFIYLVCCIYHKPRGFDESSDESSSSDSDSESNPSCRDHPAHNHNHRPNLSQSPSSNPQEAQRSPVHEPELLDSTEPNAYEKKGKRKAGALTVVSRATDD